MGIRIRIDELLEAQGKTAYALAKETGIGHSALLKIRHNQNKAIDLAKLAAICTALNCEPGDVLVMEKPSKKTKRIIAKTAP